jgi:adenosylcobinamide-phosphate synthase
MNAALCVLAGAGLDLLVGDPPWLPHPVRAIGWLIARLETSLRRTPLHLKFAGVLLWIACVGATAAVVAASLWILPLSAVYWIFSFLAVRDLDRHAVRVIDALRAGDLLAAREKLSWIVGRDTANLDAPEILRAVVETVSENLGDGVVAPLFYLALGGPVAMAAYKAVNTLDSMVGYRNETYRDLGWFSARADDAANWIPARLTAMLIWIVSLAPGYSAKQSIRITLRDGGSQPSPNSGYPEAAAAGALGIQLGGLNFYGGAESRKAFLGDPLRPLTISTFARVRAILYGVAFLATVSAALVARW